MEIDCNRLDYGFFQHQKELEEKAIEILRSGRYILGEELERFEMEVAQFLGVKYCVGVGNGLDALTMAFYLLGIGPGDEVLVPGNTFIASVMGITRNGGIPIFVEPDEYYNIDVDQIESHITKNTKAILAVHLYGQPAKMDSLMELAQNYGLKVVEDCAQSHGADYMGKKTGSFGHISCFSFYPTKNLGGFGDGGALATDLCEISEAAKCYRNYGSKIKYYNEVVGINSRLDEIQAGLLRIKLSYLETLIKRRRDICKRYSEKIKNDRIKLPLIQKEAEPVWHQYVIRTCQRECLIDFLKRNGIHTLVHYPIPPHLSEAYSYLGIKEGQLPITEQYARQVLSLPLYDGMSDEEVEYVIQVINRY